MLFLTYYQVIRSKTKHYLWLSGKALNSQSQHTWPMGQIKKTVCLDFQGCEHCCEESIGNLQNTLLPTKSNYVYFMIQPEMEIQTRYTATGKYC